MIGGGFKPHLNYKPNGQQLTTNLKVKRGVSNIFKAWLVIKSKKLHVYGLINRLMFTQWLNL